MPDRPCRVRAWFATKAEAQARADEKGGSAPQHWPKRPDSGGRVWWTDYAEGVTVCAPSECECGPPWGGEGGADDRP